MKKIKNLLTLLAIVAFQNIYAQYTDLKGVTIQASSVSYYDSGQLKNITTDELYTFSFNDGIMVHNVYSSGTISASQVYSLISIEKYMDGLITTFKGISVSGISGKKYMYEIKISEEGKLLQMIRTQPDGITKEFFKGGILELKTYKQ